VSTAMMDPSEMTAIVARPGPAEVILQAAAQLRSRPGCAGGEQPPFAHAVAGLLEEIAAGPHPAPPAWTLIGALRIARACLADAAATGNGPAGAPLLAELTAVQAVR
jgi:hypothetical protein